MKNRIAVFLRLIRYRNLLIVALTQYLMRHAIIQPILGINGFELQMGAFHFFLLVISTLLITAAGYVINDYFDTRTDMLNRPDEVVVGRFFTRRKAIILHQVFNFAGIVTGLYIAFYTGVPLLGIMFIIVAGLLWFYSTTYNRQFLTGNLVIAVLTGMVPVIVVIFEIPMLNRAYGDVLRINQASFNYVFLWVGAFGYFAFLTTLIRELIKDMEDYRGDIAQGRRSVPIVLGLNYTRMIVGGLILFTLLSLAYIYKVYLMIGFYGETDYLSLFYFLIFLLAPFIFLYYRLIKARTRKEFRYANSLAKIIMLAGLIYSLLVRYIIVTSF